MMTTNSSRFSCSGRHSANQSDLNLCAGDWVEVRSKEEILRTLDKNGRLDELPFMPQMFQYCGRRLRVFKRAHKTCDTVNDFKGRSMNRAVHLEGVRCDGKAYGGCEAGCLIFWKTAWLKRVFDSEFDSNEESAGDVVAEGAQTEFVDQCTETDVLAGTQRSLGDDGNGPAYVCQATQVPAATTPLSPWKLGQYLEDLTSGNASAGKIVRGFIYIGYRHWLINLGIGLGPPLRWLYDILQGLWGGIPYPRRSGTIPLGGRTPTETLNLQPGELVRVKSLDAILATCDTSDRNRGMKWDAELVPYCGGAYRVLKRVTRILDEKSGKMLEMKNPCILLEGVVCQARYSECRLFCPRSVYLYWREIWLERVSEDALASAEARLVSKSLG